MMEALGITYVIVDCDDVTARMSMCEKTKTRLGGSVSICKAKVYEPKDK